VGIGIGDIILLKRYNGDHTKVDGVRFR